MTTTGELLASLSGLGSATAMEHLMAITSGGGGDVYIGPVLAAKHTEQTATAERVGPVLSASVVTTTTSATHTSATTSAAAITEAREASHG